MSMGRSQEIKPRFFSGDGRLQRREQVHQSDRLRRSRQPVEAKTVPELHRVGRQVSQSPAQA